MDDKGIPVRPFLGSKDFADSDRIERVRAKAINGFRRKRNKSTTAQNLGGARNVGGISWNNSIHGS